MVRVLWSLARPQVGALDLALLRDQSVAMLGALRCVGWDMGVVFMPDAGIRELNGTYRGVDRATDVLSFPYHDELERPGELPAPAHDGDRNLEYHWQRA